jgi:hypothetical protein
LSYAFHEETCDWFITFLVYTYGVCELDSTHCKMFTKVMMWRLQLRMPLEHPQSSHCKISLQTPFF